MLSVSLLCVVSENSQEARRSKFPWIQEHFLDISVVDLDSFNPDPDPAFQVNPDTDPGFS
jgi:hypothetical protein